MRCAAETRRCKTRPPAPRCGRSRCSTSDAGEGSRCGGFPRFLDHREIQAMQDLRGCAGAMIALGALLSFVAPLSAQDAAPQDKAKIAAGETVYNTYCQVCHGDALVSTGQVFDLRRLTANDRARFENSVRNGKNQMP